MITLLSLLGYGDSLISAALLERAGEAAKAIRVVGTQVTAKVGELMIRPTQPDEILFDEVPAFYALKKHGAVQALKDSLKLRRWVQSKKVKRDDTLIFEKAPSIRNRWMVYGTGCRIVEIPRLSTVYEDRTKIFAPLLGGHHVFPSVRLPSGRARTLLINPVARSADRSLSAEVVRRLVVAAGEKDVAVTLIDIDGSYAVHAGSVANYLRSPKLFDAAQALKTSDRYIGPDSFFLHLAYYYDIPELVFFGESNTYFRPPGLFEQGCGLFFKDLEDQALMRSKLDWFLG